MKAGFPEGGPPSSTVPGAPALPALSSVAEAPEVFGMLLIGAADPNAAYKLPAETPEQDLAGAQRPAEVEVPA